MESKKNLELLEQAKQGDKNALGELLIRYRPYLRILAQRHMDAAIRVRLDPSDVVQQTSLEAHRGIDRFRGDSEGEWVAWVRKILENNAAQAIRRHLLTQKRSARREVYLDESNSAVHSVKGELRSREKSPSKRALNSERSVKLALMLHNLPESQREAIRLRYLEGRSLKELAESLGRSETAVAGLLKRGLRNLRDDSDVGAMDSRY